MPKLFGDGSESMSEKEREKWLEKAKKELENKPEGTSNKGPVVVLPTVLKPRPPGE